MATPTTCYPWWHTKFAPLRAAAPIYVRSGCSIDASGNVACDPEAMRARAEKQLRDGGYLRRLSLETYTLARYMQGEVGGGHGSGTLEEAVAVGEAAANRVKVERLKNVDSLLLYRQRSDHPNYGRYGPIHNAGTSSAPYGRWATTHTDPTVLACLLADLVTSGRSGNFNRGADDQAGLQYATNFPSIPGAITTWANRSAFWVGPLPGVDHWRTFLVKHHRGESSKTAWGATWVAYTIAYLDKDMQANGGVRKMAAPWSSSLTECARGGLLAAAGAIGIVAGAVALERGWAKR